MAFSGPYLKESKIGAVPSTKQQFLPLVSRAYVEFKLDVYVLHGGSSLHRNPL